MTNDELHSKCQQAQERIYNTLHITSSSFWMDTLKANKILESLCREMMAAGLEMAAVKLDYCCGLITGPGENNIHCCNRADWCRQEAQRVREGKA